MQQYGGGHFGLGVAFAGDGDSISFSHGGRDEGFVAHVIMWPKLGRGIVVLTNGVSGQFINEVRRGFGEVYGISGVPPRQGRTVAKVDSTSLASLLGQYRLVQRADSITITVSAANGVLAIENNFNKLRARVWPESTDTLFDESTGQRFIFERDSASGKVNALRIGRGADAPRAVRR